MMSLMNKCIINKLESNLINQIAAGDYPGKQHPKYFWRILVTKFYELFAFLKHPSKGYFGPKKRLNSLMETGITSFIDLTVEGELPTYSQLLELIDFDSKAVFLIANSMYCWATRI